MLTQEISLKKSRLLYLFLSILFTGILIYFALGPYQKTRAVFEINFRAAIVLTAFLIVATIYSWYNLFDRNNVITFGPKGIIHKKKLIDWQDIESYKTVNHKSDTLDSLELVLTLFSSEEYVISLLGLDTDAPHIRTCIMNFPHSSIVDEGHFEKN